MKFLTILLVLCIAIAVVQAQHRKFVGNRVQGRVPNRRFFGRNGMQQQRGFQRNGLFRGNRRNSRLKQVLLPGAVVQQPLASQQNQQAAVKPEQTVPVLPKVVDSVPPVEEITLVKTDIPEEMTIVQPTETVVKA